MQLGPGTDTHDQFAGVQCSWPEMFAKCLWDSGVTELREEEQQVPAITDVTMGGRAQGPLGTSTREPSPGVLRVSWSGECQPVLHAPEPRTAHTHTPSSEAGSAAPQINSPLLLHKDSESLDPHIPFPSQNTLCDPAEKDSWFQGPGWPHPSQKTTTAHPGSCLTLRPAGFPSELRRGVARKPGCL